MMNTYTFYLDKKFTQWQRDEYEVKAESTEEALDKLLIFKEDPNDTTIKCVDVELLEDTVDYILPNENLGNATEEIYMDQEGKHGLNFAPVWTNVSKEEEFQKYLDKQDDKYQIRELEDQLSNNKNTIKELHLKWENEMVENRLLEEKIRDLENKLDIVTQENIRLNHITKELQEQINQMFNSVEDRYYELREKYNNLRQCLEDVLNYSNDLIHKKITQVLKDNE